MVGNIFWCMEKNIPELLKILASALGVCFCIVVMGCNVFTLISLSVTPKKHHYLRNTKPSTHQHWRKTDFPKSEKRKHFY